MTAITRTRRRAARRGFTLVEVIVMVTIVAILGGVVATTMLRQAGQGRAQTAKVGCARIRTAIQSYLLDMGLSQPGQDFDITVLTLRSEDGGGVNGPYLNSEDHLLDPWGNYYEIEFPPGTKNFDFDVVSYGEDKQPGGEEVNADIRQ